MTFHEQSEHPDPAIESPLQQPVDVGSEAPKHRRTGLMVGISAVAVVAIGGGVYALAASGDSSKPAAQVAPLAPGTTANSGSPTSASATASPAATAGSMKIPSSAGTLTLMTDSVGDRVTSELRQAQSALPASALFGAYEKTGSSTYFANLILLEITDGDATSYETAYTSEGPSGALWEINGNGGVTDVKEETPAGPGGAMICGDIKYTQTPLRACMWIDATEYATAAFPATTPEAQAAAYSMALWKASEQR
jgi:hypothetical protein